LEVRGNKKLSKLLSKTYLKFTVMKNGFVGWALTLLSSNKIRLYCVYNTLKFVRNVYFG